MGVVPPPLVRPPREQNIEPISYSSDGIEPCGYEELEMIEGNTEWIYSDMLTQGDPNWIYDRKEDNRMDKRQQVEHNFTYHAPKPEQQPKYGQLREMAKALGIAIVDLTPESREQSLALTDLEDCIMHANAAIARHS